MKELVGSAHQTEPEKKFYLESTLVTTLSADPNRAYHNQNHQCVCAKFSRPPVTYIYGQRIEKIFAINNENELQFKKEWLWE